MSIGSAIFVKNGFKLEKVDESNTITVDVVSSTELLSEGQLEEYDYDTEYENIYKTNILLSEPLRSVGGVKDRLFRDSDGLWKVERNVGEKSNWNGTAWAYMETNGDYYRIPLTSNIGARTTNLDPSLVKVKSNLFKSTSNVVETNDDCIGIHPTQGFQFKIKKTILTGDTNNTTVINWLNSKGFVLLYVLATPTIETLPDDLQQKLNNTQSFKNSNYLYTIVDKANTLPSYVRDNLKPTLHATFKGGGWYTRFKSDQEFIEAQEQIGNKADIEVIDDLKNDLQDYAKREDYLAGIGEVNSSLEAYQSLLETIERDLKGVRDENGEFVLGADGNPINVGAIKEIEDIVGREAATNLNLGELSARWNFIGTNIIMASEGLLIGEIGVDENGKDVLISGIRVGKDRIDFVEKKAIISEITGSRMKINRAIFVQSISVGEHKIETMSGGHTIWTWVPTI